MNLPMHDTAQSPSMALRLHGGAVRFGPRDGLRAIELSMARGERLALVGPSGSGKTSLLRAIAGLDAFAAGRLAIDDVDVTTMPPERRRCVYLHQTPALFPHLSVLDNVAFPLVLRGRGRSVAREQALALLEQMRLSPLAKRAPARLSGGERHRTALARALAAEPSLLLLDEPFAALDPSLRAEIRAQVMAILAAPGGPAVIVVTHDIDEAALMGTRLAVLLEGGIAQDAGTDDVIQRPCSLAVARLLGVPNVVPGYRDGRGRWTSEIGSAPAPGPSGRGHAVGWTDMIHVCAGGSEIDGLPGARGTVVSVEHRGLGRVVRVRVNQLELIGHADACVSWHPGDAVAVSLASGRTHIVSDDQASHVAHDAADDGTDAGARARDVR